jgi:ankyrin repeat protein
MGLGADAERGNAQGMTAMMMACQSGHLAVLKSMLARKANIECRDKNGWTPLMHAAENGHLELVKALLAIGADRKAKDASGRTALELARNRGHKRIETELKKPRFSLRRSATVDHRRLDL